MLDAAALRELLARKWYGPPPSAKASRHLQAAMGLSERRACSIVGADRKMVRYRFRQEAIADYLDRAMAALDDLRSEAEDAIVLLQERRSALVSAAVTGKIDVRNLVAANAEAA